jgi:GNAT superfamily N-acetyltransferase
MASSTFGEFRAGMIADLVALWNRSAPADPMTPRRFRDLVLLDPNFDRAGLQVAFVDGALAGAVYAVRRTVAAAGADLEPDTGWILFFLVDPAYRRQGIGTALLDRALRWLAGHGRTTVAFSPYTPNYLLPGLDAAAYPAAARLLARLGFTVRYAAVAMDRGLLGYEIPDEVRTHLADLRARGYQLRTAADDDLVDLIPLARDHFNPDWGRAIREGIAAGLPTDRIIIAREPPGRLVGWAMHGTYEGIIDRFGPFGVLTECRGAGLGRALLHLCLERMRALGAHNAWFLWTGPESAAGQLYRKTGFTVTRTFQIMSRTGQN